MTPGCATRLSAAEGLGKLGEGIALGPLDAYIARELDGRGVPRRPGSDGEDS